MSFGNIELKKDIIHILEKMPAYSCNSAGTQHVVRCPYCGDSVHQDHGHFAIRIDADDEEPMLYRCLKCPVSGILTTDVLDELEADYNPQLASELRISNRKIIKKSKFLNNKIQSYIIPVASDRAMNLVKLGYLNDRIGSDWSLEQLPGIRVIPSIVEFLKVNEIESVPGVDLNYLKVIENNYLGFLSMNQNTIILRRITENPRLNRYLKVTINPKNINANSFYGVPSSIALTYTNDIEVHASEGTFDILSVLYNLNQDRRENQFYYAACGFGYVTILKYLIYNGINTGIHLHIYSDKDKTDTNHLSYLFRKSHIIDWINHITIHRNQMIGEKDYGVPMNRIIDTTRNLK